MSTVLGTAVVIGINGYTIAGYIVDDADVKATGEVEAIRGEDNATTAKIISDPGKRITLNAMVTAVPDLAIGDTVSVNSVGYMVEDFSVKYSRSAAKVSIAAIKEDSMTYA